MLVACKAQRVNESQYVSRRNRQRIVVIVIHKSNITVPADFANAVRKFRRAILLRSCVSVERGFVERVSASTNRSFVRSFGGFSVRVGTAFWWHGAEVSQSPEGAAAAFSQKGRDFRCIVRPLLTGQSVAASASRQGLRHQAALQQQSSSQSDEHAVPIAQPRLYPWKLQSHR